MKIKEFEKKFGFRPEFSYNELNYLFERNILTRKAENTELLTLIKKLTSLAYPDEEKPEIPEKVWYNFYLPVRMGKIVAIKVTIVNYKNMYALVPNDFSSLEVYPGNKKIEEKYFDIVKEIIKFSEVLMREPKLIRSCLPPEVRTGKILGKYIMENILSEEEKEKIMKKYQKHVKNMKHINSISLREYLNVCAICYRAAFGKKVDGMSPEKMYKRWADGRDCGMFKIKRKSSKRAFMYWLEQESCCGGHPFEIVFSWSGHGIHLYPPSKDAPWFEIYVTNYNYAWTFLRMVKALIRERVSFKAPGLEKVLDYLAGETYFRVNEHAEHWIDYLSCKDKRRYIDWDEIKIPKFKKLKSLVN